jgi:hypothetical protein
LQLLSRAALWMFDLCARQIAQVRVFFIAFKTFLLSFPRYDRRLWTSFRVLLSFWSPLLALVSWLSGSQFLSEFF